MMKVFIYPDKDNHENVSFDVRSFEEYLACINKINEIYKEQEVERVACIRAEVEEEVNDELRDQIRDEIKNECRNELKDDIEQDLLKDCNMYGEFDTVLEMAEYLENVKSAIQSACEELGEYA